MVTINHQAGWYRGVKLRPYYGDEAFFMDN